MLFQNKQLVFCILPNKYVFETQQFSTRPAWRLIHVTYGLETMNYGFRWIGDGVTALGIGVES